jgi:hypothetical protein
MIDVVAIPTQRGDSPFAAVEQASMVEDLEAGLVLGLRAGDEQALKRPLPTVEWSGHPSLHGSFRRRK